LQALPEDYGISRSMAQEVPEILSARELPEALA
jgi:hypothetical protein